MDKLFLKQRIALLLSLNPFTAKIEIKPQEMEQIRIEQEIEKIRIEQTPVTSLLINEKSIKPSFINDGFDDGFAEIKQQGIEQIRRGQTPVLAANTNSLTMEVENESIRLPLAVDIESLTSGMGSNIESLVFFYAMELLDSLSKQQELCFDGINNVVAGIFTQDKYRSELTEETLLVGVPYFIRIAIKNVFPSSEFLKYVHNISIDILIIAENSAVLRNEDINPLDIKKSIMSSSMKIISLPFKHKIEETVFVLLPRNPGNGSFKIEFFCQNHWLSQICFDFNIKR